MFDLYSSCVCLYAGILKECLKWQGRSWSLFLSCLPLLLPVVSWNCLVYLFGCIVDSSNSVQEGRELLPLRTRKGLVNRDGHGCSILSEVMNERTLPSTTSMHALFLGGGVCDSKSKPSKAWNMLLFCVEKTQFRRLHLLVWFFFFFHSGQTEIFVSLGHIRIKWNNLYK